MHSNPVQNVTFASNGDEAYGYLSLPASGSGPGLIVIQEWWGLTTHMAHMADRFAAEVYVALAPDLYGGATTHDEAEALQLLLEIPVERAARDLRGAVEYLLSRDDVVGETSRRRRVLHGRLLRVTTRGPGRGARSRRWWLSTRSAICQTTTRGSRRPC